MRRPSDFLSHDVAREELSHLAEDLRDFLHEEDMNDEDINDEDLLETISGLLKRMDPFMRIASMV